MGRIILVRHADAGPRSSWDGPDARRPLSRKGRKQADRLAEALAGIGFDRLLASPAIRCHQTLEPLGAALGIDVEEEPLIGEGAAGDGALDALLGITNTAPTIAACSHGDVIPLTVLEAQARGATRWGQLSPSKASWFVLETDGDRVTEAIYHPPPGP